MQSQVNRMRGCPPQPARARPVVDHAKPCPGRCQRAARRQHKICAQIDINNLPSPLSSFDDSNSLGTIGCADGSTSPASPVKTGVVAQLLRGPSRDHSLITAHPRMRQLQHALRGGRTEFRGLEKPVLLTFLPAYMWGAVGTLVGVHSAVPALAGAAVGGLFACLNRFCDRRVWVTPRQPLHVVVTGGSRGLGKALCRELLSAGDRVLLTSRTQEAVDRAVAELREEVGGDVQVYGVAADVSEPAGVAAVEAAAVQQLGRVDAWVNNAGYSGSFRLITEQEDEQIEQVVRTNLLGTLLCTRQAISLFSRQPGGGHIFNMDGAGADGLPTPNYAAYGATKAGITHLTATLQRELAGTRVRLHTVSPGMILTDLLLEGATTANKQAFNILCEQPETTAAFLVPRIKSAVARNASGTYVRYLTPATALARMVKAPLLLGRFFDAQGAPVYPPERERILGRHAKVTQRRQAEARRRNGALQMAYGMSLMAGVLVMLAESPVLRG